MFSRGIRPTVNLSAQARSKHYVVDFYDTLKKYLGIQKEKDIKVVSTVKVTLIGLSNRAAETTALLLKQSPLIDVLSLHGAEKSCTGTALELSHIDTNCKIEFHYGQDNLASSVEGADIILLFLGSDWRTALNENSQFKMNADSAADIAEVIGRTNPHAIVGIASQPMNSIVPLVSEVLKNTTVYYDPRKVFGITSVDVVRANTFVANSINMDPSGVIVPVVGGHSQETIVPIISQRKPNTTPIDENELELIFNRVRSAEQDVFLARDYESDNYLSAAFGVSRFTQSIIKGIMGLERVVECAYVRTIKVPGVRYFTLPVQLGPSGIEHFYSLPHMSEFEKECVTRAIFELKNSIRMGENFATARLSVDD